MALKIVYEDEDILVIDKPAGILIYPDKYTHHKTLLEEVRRYCPKIKNVGERHRPGIVHRLDRDTSGLLVWAKNQVAYNFLISQFKNHQIKKKYYALVFGKVKEPQGVIAYSIAPWGRKKKKSALTYYRVIRYYLFNGNEDEILSNDNQKNRNKRNIYTLLDVEIKTGIMHQIRQHLKMLGHPIVGDKKYVFKNLIPPCPIGRQFLHAYYLQLNLLNGKKREFQIPLSQDLEEYLKNFKLVF